MRIRACVIGVVCSLLMCGTAAIGDTVSEIGNSYTPHSTIYIFGNEDFNAANGVTCGNGSMIDPFVIEGWEIEAGKATGITVRETSAHFVIRNVFIHSSDWTYYGISLRNIINGRVESSNITDNWKGINIRESGNVSISWNQIIQSEEGILITDSFDIEISGNTVAHNSPHSGVAVLTSSDVRIVANTVSQSGWAGISISSSSNVAFSENEITKNQHEGIRVSMSANISLSGDRIFENRDGIGVVTSSLVNITRGDITLNDYHGIRLESSSHIIVDLSYVAINKWHGIHILNSTETIITRTIFRSNRFAVYITASQNVTISKNVPWSNGNGAYVEASSAVTFTGNDYYDNWVHGVISQKSKDLRFMQNRFHSNNVDGIRMVETTNSSVVRNIFSDNMRGLYLENTEGIATFHNEFKDNTGHVQDSKGSENVWDGGYPTGGNFWSDYNGTDEFKGQGQNESGSDDIGDIPYVIDFNSLDNYPLMSPPGDLPSAPLNLSASWGDSYVNITWSPPATDGGFPVTAYRIYRGMTSGGESHLMDKMWHTYYNDTTVTNGVRYYYRVSALNGVGEGPQSNEAASIPTAIPGPPTAMQAVLSGIGKENVTINWSLSSDDGLGQGSVVKYVVHRGSNYSRDGDGYQSIASVPNGTTQFEDVLAGDGDSNDYFYLVCAVDVNNRTRCSEDQVGKFTRSLHKGPNLISIPLIPVNIHIDSLLMGVALGEVWSFDSVDKIWSSFVRLKPYDVDAFHVERSMGFWVNVSKDSTFTIAGAVPTSSSLMLVPGWNLIGFSSFNRNYTVFEFKSMFGAERVEGFDALNPPYFTREMHDNDVLAPGYGYWVWTTKSTS